MEQEKQAQIEQAVTTILEAVGEDTQRAGLIDTPKRVAKMYAEVFSGLTEPEFDDYKLFDSLNEGEMVLVKDIAFYSMCEHHLSHSSRRFNSDNCPQTPRKYSRQRHCSSH